MDFQLPKAYEEILDRNYETEVSLFQNDKALEILFKINELGTLVNDLYSQNENLLFLLNNGYILKKEGGYYLSEKANKFLEILGIQPKQNIKDSFFTSRLLMKNVLNYFDIIEIPDSELRRNFSFITIAENIFIKVSETKDKLECKLMLNCIPNLNLFLYSINNYLSKDGKVILYYQTVQQRKKYLVETKNFIQRQVTKFFNFFSKVIHKKIIVKSYHYSRAEILGRLVYNGFEILENVDNDHQSVVIAVLKRKISYSEGPKYGPIYKIKRIGKGGKEIYIYKFRTLYPYAEYLNDFIYQTHKLNSDGFITDDFRISALGKIIRRLWLDELPMFINLLKGDIKIVGVRPLSAHYLNLYPIDLRFKRSKFKPGFISPYYFSLPRSIEEIYKSEEEYLSKYEKNPIVTDLQYFLKSLSNILLTNARST
ncbi:MAG: hypothetical protein A2315_10715 [Ignavibacteria bacterium RIFOXYB2_FULL_35_12]|nr:MAG: hypothetical protein A2058_14665 [Ignavibacteria bacterium GWA2_36_19]OGU51025.1 MAG: hypothetical protein A2006_09030 [Ignavibacteria bacterium GWC2_35_8]OGU62328.1 MAG: hypothetical protein A2X60_13790 [Ignavibacteria bacterium GWF2_35_20]OGU80437.1 MAG: hypothetical protein A2254_03170 [Ignavibacteria bacterium RIFOXYA2_FULL_35_9]OGU86201.1 MAG: hypothetical protein A3K31_14490 [Ignavibacteria bacterium RIFOXYA12_FULL_35_25]OGU90851.1 MAG: hypothetical protein A2492_04725 [Ignavibac